MNEGKKDRRDPIRTIKTKNPVAKAHQTVGTGSGAHKDKKRAMKQGEVKHKNQEYAESYEAHLTRQLNELSIDTLKNYKEKRKTQQDAAKAAVPNPRTGDKDWVDQAVRSINMSTAQKKINRKEKAVGEEYNAEYDDEAGMADNNLETLKRAVDGIDDVINTGDNLPEWCQEKIAVAKSMLVTVWDYMLSEKESFDIGMGQASHGKAGDDVTEGWSDAMVARRTGGPRTPYSVYIKGKKWKDFENDDHAEAVANKLRAKFKADGRDPSVITVAPTDMSEGMAETVTDPRAGMAKIYRKLAPKIERYKDSFLAGQLYDELENYAELHGAEKEFKQMMATARGRAHMEYDTNPGGFHNWFWFLPFADEDLSEGESAREKWNRASAEREKKHDDAEKEMNARHARGEEDMKGSIDRLEKHVNTKEGLRDPKDNPCWKGYKPVGTKKKAGKTVPNCVPKEGWTHDSLAAELFETENTYEDRLSNLLNKRLGK